TSRSCAPVGLSKRAAMIQAAQIAVPPMNGAKLNVARTMAPGVSDECAATERLNRLTLGRFDHGPVHNTTTTIRTMKGSQARKISPGGSTLPAATAAASSAAE